MMPDLSLIEILEILLIAVIVVYLIRFIWIMFIKRSYEPVSWQLAVKKKQVPPTLLRLSRTFPDKTRFFNIWLQAERLKKSSVKGEFAELGVYKGETARLIHHCDPKRQLHLFDTFEGFKTSDLQVEEGNAASYTPRNFADTSAERVKRYIAGNDNIFFHPGHFPESTSGIEDINYALVHIDADLYNPIKAGLEYFYPRLSPGGIIIVHDYNERWRGALKAVNEFDETISEVLVPVPDRDNSVMIIKSK
jgi:O-methyltransferase